MRESPGLFRPEPGGASNRSDRVLTVHVSRAHRNLVRTTAVLVVLFALAVFVGSRFGWPGLWLAVLLVAAFIGYVLLRSDVLALRAVHAYPVSEAEQPTLCRIVREMTTAAQVPMPRVYVSPTRAVNALATGRGPSRAVICVTEGALGVLDDDELRGVVGHELVHIRNRDTLPASVVGVLNRIALVIPVVGVVLSGLARLAILRSREFDADRGSARISGQPLALASALRKFDTAARELALPTEPGVVAASHLMITSPLRGRGLLRLCRSHPSTPERVARLEGLAGYRR